ncbi:hypothetical protein fugu_019451 [Takifugu bimaculatus]|uniref:MBD domain-containing protein n=1 Tax=Takifugu bimaculatus TaxID=433685 RepID=A0A4Z2BKD2_9TELE|nr:hypothetical protein fugu_019451 [Takifugu bimaculatus]
MERKKSDCPALPPGWKKEEVIRKSGLSAGKSDVYYYRSRGTRGVTLSSGTQSPLAEMTPLKGFLGPSIISQQNSSEPVDTADASVCSRLCSSNSWFSGGSAHNKRTGGKPDLNTALPIRQTASIFKQPVTKVTSHPGNKVKMDSQRAFDQPKQLFWERRLKGLHSLDVTEQVLRTMDLPKGLQSVGPDISNETLLSSIASALHMTSAPVTGQTSVAAEKNPVIWLNTCQPLCKAFTVTEEHIREQELKVYQARRSLEEALTADSMARMAENTQALLEGQMA